VVRQVAGDPVERDQVVVQRADVTLRVSQPELSPHHRLAVAVVENMHAGAFQDPDRPAVRQRIQHAGHIPQRDDLLDGLAGRDERSVPVALGQVAVVDEQDLVPGREFLRHFQQPFEHPVDVDLHRVELERAFLHSPVRHFHVY
jgi:hypothetical protein